MTAKHVRARQEHQPEYASKSGKTGGKTGKRGHSIFILERKTGEQPPKSQALCRVFQPKVLCPQSYPRIASFPNSCEFGYQGWRRSRPSQLRDAT